MTLKLHHLQYSRSTRIIWLLEELGLDYEMISYEREPATFRAPDSLKAPHPLGKAPALEDGDLVIVESGAIIEHIVEARADGRLAPRLGDPERPKYLEWMHFAEGSAMLPIVVTLIGKMTGAAAGGIQDFFAPELEKTLDYLASAVTKQDYLLASGFSAADVQMSYVIEAGRMGGMLGGRPALSAYLERIEQRPAYRRAIDKGGPVALPM